MTKYFKKKFLKKLTTRPQKKSETNEDELYSTSPTPPDNNNCIINNHCRPWTQTSHHKTHESSSQWQLFSSTLESNSSSRHPTHHSHKDKKSLSEQQSGEGRKHVMSNLPPTKGSIKKRLRPIKVSRSNAVTSASRAHETTAESASTARTWRSSAGPVWASSVVYPSSVCSLYSIAYHHHLHAVVETDRPVPWGPR
jgi:hypothetical protein